MESDLLLAGVASALMRGTSPVVPTPTQVQGVQVGITDEQIARLSVSVGNAVENAVRNVELPAPIINVPSPQFPPNLAVAFSDEELARIATALSAKSSSQIKSQIYQRSILIDIGIGTVPDSTFVSAEFPAGIKVASFNFEEQAGLIGVTLSASLVNTFTKPCGFFVALASADQLNFDTSPYTAIAEVGNAKTPDSQILLSVFTHQNSTATTINPNTRASAISFGLDDAVTIVNSQTTLALYAFQTKNPATGAGQTGQLMSAILTAYYIPSR